MVLLTYNEWFSKCNAQKLVPTLISLLGFHTAIVELCRAFRFRFFPPLLLLFPQFPFGLFSDSNASDFSIILHFKKYLSRMSGGIMAKFFVERRRAGFVFIQWSVRFPIRLKVNLWNQFRKSVICVNWGFFRFLGGGCICDWETLDRLDVVSVPASVGTVSPPQSLST